MAKIDVMSVCLSACPTSGLVVPKLAIHVITISLVVVAVIALLVLHAVHVLLAQSIVSADGVWG